MNAFSKTRFDELGYRKDAPGLWRVVCVETGASVGPQYASKQELLSDFDRYARESWQLGASPGDVNARLIAAAPDLAEALHAVQSQMESTLDSPTYRALSERIAAALAKAGV